MGAGTTGDEGERSHGKRSHARVPVSSPGDQHEVEARSRAGQSSPAGATHCSGCAGGAPCTSCGGEVARDGLVPDGGAPLAPALRADVESRLGPVGEVRLHTGGAAAHAAQRLDARAYTLGQSIVFGEGAYAPHTTAGYQLLLHELVHAQRDPAGEMVHRQEDTDTPTDTEPTVEQIIADPSLFTDDMIDEFLSEQDAADAEVSGEPDSILLTGVDDLGPVDGIPLARYDRMTHWEGTPPEDRRRWVADNLPRARFTSIEERRYYERVAMGLDQVPSTDLTPWWVSSDVGTTPWGDYGYVEPGPTVDWSAWLGDYQSPTTPTGTNEPTCTSCHSPTTIEPTPMVDWGALQLDDRSSTTPLGTSEPTCTSCHGPSTLDTQLVPSWNDADLGMPVELWEPVFEPMTGTYVMSDREIESGEDTQWITVGGGRGERTHLGGYTGPLRPLEEYTKPYAVIAAQSGNYEFAELAEHYLCATCHIIAAVGHIPSDSEFNVGAYTFSYQRNYVWLFNMNPISSAWNLGVTTGEVITGESSGLNLNQVMLGVSDRGRTLGGSERLWMGVEAGVGWALLGYGRFGGRGPVETTPRLTPPRGFNYEVIQGGRTTGVMSPRGTTGGGYRSGIYTGGNTAPLLDVAPMIEPVVVTAPRLTLVPELAPTVTPSLLPSVAPWMLPYTQWSSYPSTTVWPLPAPQPQPDPGDPDQDPCAPGTHRIAWPFPIWTTLGYGDAGATSGLYDRPPTLYVTRVRPPRRSRSLVRQYTRNNAAALAPLRAAGVRGAIHHKVPLYVDGPDITDNFVFLPNAEHTAWHNLLARQGVTGWMIRDPYGTIYCVP